METADGRRARECRATTAMYSGAQNLEVICEDAYNMGIKYLTVYAFSNGELETFTGRSRCADEAVPQIYKDVYQDGA